MNNCIFCKIITNQVTAEIIDQNDSVFVIKDIAPKKPIHYLIIPKQHFQDITALEAKDTAIAGDLLMMAKKLSQKDERHKSFKLINNNGSKAGQEVNHIHIHFLAGY